MILNFREVSPDTKCTCSRNDRFFSQMTELLVWPNICTKKDSNELLPKGMFFAYGWIEREITLNQITLISFWKDACLPKRDGIQNFLFTLKYLSCDLDRHRGGAATVAACKVVMTTSDKTESFVASYQVFQSVIILGPQHIIEITRLDFAKSGFRSLIDIHQVITRKRNTYWNR